MEFYMLHYALALISTSVTTFLLGIFVYFHNKTNKVNISFFLFSLSMSIWSGFQAGVGSTFNNSVTTFCLYPEQFAVTLIPSFFLYFIHNLLEIKRKWVIRTAFALSLFFMSVLPTKLYIAGIDSHTILKATIKPGPLYIYMVIFMVISLSFGLTELFFEYLRSTGARRNQMKYLFLSLLLAAVTGTINFMYLFNIKLPPFFPFLNYGEPLYTFAMAYAIVRHRLMDINVVIKKTVIYAAIYSFSVAIFVFLTIFVGQYLIYRNIDHKFSWMSLFSILIITLFLKPLDNLVTRITDKYLFRKKYQYQKTLKAASRGMTKIKSLPRLLDLIVRMITSSVRVSHATVFLLKDEESSFVASASRGKFRIPTGFIKNNPENPLVRWLIKNKEPLVCDEISSRMRRETRLTDNMKLRLERIVSQMQELKSSVCIPSFSENRLIGFLLLGEKLSGDMYTQEDLDIFSTLANQAALAIENAQSYEELKDTRDQSLQTEKLATIGKFANEVAHEIKNPLQAIRTFVEYLPTEYDRKEFREKFMQVVGAEIERIDSFVRQLVGFSKPKPLDLSPIDIRQLLDNTLQLLENDFKNRMISIKRNYLRKGIKIIADRTQLKQVFLNLFLNSMESIEPTKTNQLSIETFTQDSRLIVKITDTGCGISQENLKNLFKPFFTTKQNGTGLGLIIVKSIIENHKGSISVESNLGKGTTFSISLPYN